VWAAVTAAVDRPIRAQTPALVSEKYRKINSLLARKALKYRGFQSPYLLGSVNSPWRMWAGEKRK
jgi:hypothetical protein